MPKHDTQALQSPLANPDAAVAVVPTPAALRLGQMVQVQVAEGLLLMNNEAGAPFAAGTPTPQTVTVTLLRRLADGDLTLV